MEVRQETPHQKDKEEEKMMKEVKFKPLNQNVLVQIVEKIVSEGGVILPASTLNHGIVTGVILDIGESIYDAFGKELKINVVTGDTVYFRKVDSIEVIPNTGKFLVAYKGLIGKAA